MDTIHILQKTYEDLYLARIPLIDFLQKRLPVVSSQWIKDCVERVIFNDENLSLKQKEKLNKSRKDITQLDIFYLIKILLDNENWNSLQECFPEDSYYFIQDNRDLYFKIQEIRCNVMHPSFTDYSYEDSLEWEKSIISFVNIFSPDKKLDDYRKEYHNKEKEKLLQIITDKVITPAINSEKLTEEFKLNIRNTKERLENQTTAEGIIAFFTDALDSLQGQEIGKTLELNDLDSFERIKETIFKEYFK